jgi:hypothetical protein
MQLNQASVVCTYHVDAGDRLVFADEGWRAFARMNAAPGYADPSALYGQPLLSFISDPTTRHIYAGLLERVRREQLQIRVPFRCDAPSCRRWLELVMTPRPDGGVTFVSRELRTEPRREPVEIATAAPGGETFVRMCGWCKKVDAGGQWLEIEDAIVRLRLFSARETPSVTHGICPACVELFEAGRGVTVEPA